MDVPFEVQVRCGPYSVDLRLFLCISTPLVVLSSHVLWVSDPRLALLLFPLPLPSRACPLGPCPSSHLHRPPPSAHTCSRKRPTC